MHEKPTHLDLFSGIGGFALAALWAGFRTVAFCEIDKYCQKVLAKNFLSDAKRGGRWENGERGSVAGMEAGRQDDSMPITEPSPRIHGNIFDFDGTQFRSVDLITAGFPCQPYSVAGKQRGSADDRDLWPETRRVIAEARPTWFLGENVPGLISMGKFGDVPPVGSDGSPAGDYGELFSRTGRSYLYQILEDLREIGYSVQPFVVPACAVDARHRRMRLFLVAHRDVPLSDGDGFTGCPDAGSSRAAVYEEPTRPLDAFIPARPSRAPTASEVVAHAEKRTERTGLRESEQTGEWWRRSGNRSGEDDVAHPDRERREQRGKPETGKQRAHGHQSDRRSKDVSNGSGERSQGVWTHRQQEPEGHGSAELPLCGRGNGTEWRPEPGVCRVVNGLPDRVDRLKALGNAVVPDLVYEILRAIRQQIR